MARNRIREAVDRFVAEIEQIIETEASERVQKRLQSITENFGNKPMSVKRSRKVVPRPCPVPKCKAQAAPRFHQLCRKHDDELSLEEGDAHRAKAERPGGKWYKLGIGKYATADRKKAAKRKGKKAVKQAAAPKAAAVGDDF